MAITKCDKKNYCEAWRVLENVTESVTKCGKYYKAWQKVWQNVTGITKCDRKCDKMWQVLQSVTENYYCLTIITKWDIAPSSGSSSFSCGYNNEPNDS